MTSKEGMPQSVSQNEKASVETERQKAFNEIAGRIRVWGEEFKQLRQERVGVAEGSADIMYEFANFLEERSKDFLEEVRASGEYRAEQATAKLHEFNIAQAELLSRSAEIFAFYPDAIDILAQTYPWLSDIKKWAEDFKKQDGVSEK